MVRGGPAEAGRPPPPLCAMSAAATVPIMRRFLTALLGVLLATEEMQEDAQGTLTLWFHENRDKDGNHSNKVYGIGASQQLPRPTQEHHRRLRAQRRTQGSLDHVRVSGMRPRPFQRGLESSTRSRRPLLITAFSLTLMPEISSNWRRGRPRGERERYPADSGCVFGC